MYEGYGLTETIGPIAFNVPGARKAGSVGRIIPDAEVKFVDDDGHDLPAGETGEILMRGPMIMQGYYHLPDVTKEALTPDGWFKSGDLGHLDPDGYLHVTGRKKELIIVAGEKAVPREIEDVLRTHPAVADAAAVGKKDPSRGEVVVAFVHPQGRPAGHGRRAAGPLPQAEPEAVEGAAGGDDGRRFAAVADREGAQAGAERAGERRRNEGRVTDDVARLRHGAGAVRPGSSAFASSGLRASVVAFPTSSPRTRNVFAPRAAQSAGSGGVATYVACSRAISAGLTTSSQSGFPSAARSA